MLYELMRSLIEWAIPASEEALYEHASASSCLAAAPLGMIQVLNDRCLASRLRGQALSGPRAATALPLTAARQGEGCQVWV